MPPLGTSLLNAFLLAIVMIQALGAGAGRIGLLDVPRGRRRHEGAIPLTGGIAMFAAFLIPAVTLHFSQGIDWSLILGLLVLVVLGVADDVRELGPRLKIGGQVLAVLIMILPESRLIEPGMLFGAGWTTALWVAVPFTLFFMVGVINAFNMIDGLDGLAGGTAAVALFWIIISGFVTTTTAQIEPFLILFAVLGFLVFNLRHPWRKQAAVFMGDAGSMMLGGAIAFFAVDLTKGGGTQPPLPAVLWFFALPVFDTMILIGRRLADGQSPLMGDRRHLHHLLLEAGLRSDQATAILIAVAGALGGVGFFGWQVGLSPIVLLAGLILPFSLHLYFVCYGWKALCRHLAKPAAAPATAQIIGFPVAQPSATFPLEAFSRVELEDSVG